MQLWCHEAFRIIGDRMWDPADKVWLQRQLDERLAGVFATSWADLFEPFGGEVPPFVNFMRSADNPPFEPVTDLGKLKALLTEKMEDYAMEPGNSAMDLVLFKDALLHMCRISRILNQPRGNALLVGVGAFWNLRRARSAATALAFLRCVGQFRSNEHAVALGAFAETNQHS